MKNKFNTIRELKQFIILWSTQSLSQLGSAMTNFALVIWLYQSTGSALTTALLTVCSYAPYVIMSIFAGAISDKWNKKTVMLICDSFAALCTVAVLILFKTGNLAVWHLYVLNALNGLMNTIQQPASDVASIIITPEKHYQKTSGMKSFSNSLVTILTPVFATALVAVAGVECVIFFDLATFFVAFMTLLFLVKIPEVKKEQEKQESLLISMSTENFLLAFGKTPLIWCIGAVLGWIAIPLMSANMDVIFRTKIPVEMQGRVYSARNTLQFFTIPLGYLLGGALVDNVFEPFMSRMPKDSLPTAIFGSQKGSGAAFLFFVIGLAGVAVCLIFRRIKAIRELGILTDKTNKE